MDATLEQILLTAGLLFACMYFVILFVWISNIEERERFPAIVRIRKNDSD